MPVKAPLCPQHSALPESRTRDAPVKAPLCPHCSAPRPGAYGAAHAEADDRPILEVPSGFRGPRGLAFGPGRMPIDRGLAQELLRWAELMEAQARQHDWDAPPGHDPGSWPPFILESQS